MNDIIEKVRVYGDPVLRKKTDPVTVFDKELSELVENMVDIMFEYKGIGLAAPQVGISEKIITIDASFGESVDDIMVLINPEILHVEGEVSMEEGCLSVPGVWEEVVRPEKVTVHYTDVNGEEHKIDTDGMLARVIQHEIDHLEGILFVDRISSVKRTFLAKTLKSIAEGETV
ncbi:MAG: peptide deformylase [Candidatus Latescibacteria bacterium]|nr:peptide deformylase [Candidatus Latescibacterota bacterium]